MNTLIKVTIAALLYTGSVISSTIKNQCISDNDNPVCITPGCIHTASEILSNMDQSVEPCDDFFQFACGGFVKNNNIPDDKPFIISFTIIADKLIQQLRAAIEEPLQPDDPKPFSVVKKFYNICMDTVAIENDNLQTAKSIFTWLGGWPVLQDSEWKEQEFDWKNSVHKFRRIGLETSSLIFLYVGTNTKNSSARIVNLDQALLGLDREHLVEGLDNKIVGAYYNYLVELAVKFGANKSQAQKELKESVEFEISLAKITLPKEERRNITALTNIMTIEELQEKSPNIPWVEYMTNMANIKGTTFSSSDFIDVGVPQFLVDLDQLLEKTPNRVVANYLMSQAVASTVTYLTKDLKKLEMNFKKVFQGDLAMKPRWRECVELTTKTMNIAVAALYVRKYFNEAAKNNAMNLANDIRAVFIETLQHVDWMDEATRRKALDKALKMDSHVAYPTEFLDNKKLEEHYSKLQTSPDNLLKLALNIKRFKRDNSYRQLREPVNKTDWIEHAYAATVNAYYSFGENSIQLPAGILQGIFFDHDRPQYMNYGALGFVIGHEITHGFDDMGRQFDQDGILIDWWGKETEKAYLEKAQCIIDQYGNYSFPGINFYLNGVNTQGENIADNGAVKEAYLAYDAWVKQHGEEPRLPGLNYTPKQMFWVSIANVWCSKERKEYLMQDIMTNDHSPAYFRVIGALSNSIDFAKDFDCPVGSTMNPEHKCHVW